MEAIENTLLKGRVRLLQPRKGFRAGLDSVMLAAAVQAQAGDKVLDIGCGVGGAGLCVTSRIKDIYLIGIDIQEELILLAQENAKLNGVDARFLHGDIKQEKLLENNYFDEVLMNPPYEDGSEPSPNLIRATANDTKTSGVTLEDWIKYAHTKLKQGGAVTIIHKAEKLDEIILHLTKRRWFGSLTILPLYSYAGESAKRVILRARKERYRQTILKPGMVIHSADQSYTAEAERVLSDAEGLAL